MLLNLSKFFSRISKVEHSAILMLHRVGARDLTRISANQNMMVSAEELDFFIGDAKKNGWSFISLDEFVELINNNRPIKKILLLTFDDGYLDNFTKAAPVLISNQVPFAIYVTTSFIGSREVPWWYKLESILDKNLNIRTPDGLSLDLEEIKFKQAAFLLIRSKLMGSNNESLQYFNWIAEHYSEPSIEGAKLFMNWSNLEELAACPLVTIGAHTHTHAVLANLTTEKAIQEIWMSKLILEDRLGKIIRHFAYPFGGNFEATDREYAIVKDLGFDTAVTACRGEIDSSSINLHALPRYFYAPGQTLNSLHKSMFKSILKMKVKKVIRFD